MIPKLRNRLHRLERGAPDPGCPACRDRRGRIVMVDARRRADGTEMHPERRPTPCERCGETPEFIIQIVEAADAGSTKEAPTRGSLVGKGGR